MNGAIAESTFNVFFKLNYQKTYDAVLATPLGPGDVALGEIGWAVIRSTLYALGFLVVLVVMGLFTSPWAVLAVPAATLLGFAFAAVGMAATMFMRSWQDFDLIQLVVLPLFLFSGTFYPITSYPPALQLFVQLTPLYQGVTLCRALITGAVDPGSSSTSVPAVMGMIGRSSCRAASTSCCSSERPVTETQRPPCAGRHRRADPSATAEADAPALEALRRRLPGGPDGQPVRLDAGPVRRFWYLAIQFQSGVMLTLAAAFGFLPRPSCRCSAACGRTQQPEVADHRRRRGDRGLDAVPGHRHARRLHRAVADLRRARGPVGRSGRPDAGGLRADPADRAARRSSSA